MKYSVRLLLLLHLLPGLARAGAEAEQVVEAWLAAQARVETWSAEVTQTRKLVSLARPLESHGQVWFAQPNRFRWQLGDPPRTIAVRTADALLVAYPRLRQLEEYPMAGELEASWKQVLALLEVGFPSDAETFYATYEVVSATASGGRWTLELRPAAKDARRLIAKVRLELAEGDYTLLATELDFPDGSTMRNDFRAPSTNPELDEALFELEAGEGWQVVRPLDRAD